MKQAGLDVRIGWYGTNTEEITLISATQKELRASPIRIEDNFLRINGFTPDAILLNNDFSSGYPKILDTVRQPILPSHILGWHTRKKSENCLLYNKLATEFAEITGIDPWTITIDTEEVAPVDFNENEGIENVAKSVEKMLARMNDAHRKRAIKHQPFVFIKNNHGTYGMGIMVVHDAKEVLSMNRRAKNKMSIGKGHLKIDSVIIQEGIPTATIVDRLPAEPVIYLFGSELIGGFLRTNKERGIEDNLNSAGMVFRKLCMSDLRDADENGDEPLLELVYGSIARISAIATGIELHNHLTSRA
jgi:glutamate--cysteine ligase